MQEFEGMHADWKMLLANMLEFNPYFRQSARELLKNPLFDNIRIIENEKQSVDKLKLQIDADESFDYEACKSSCFEKSDYVKIIFYEVMQVHAIREFYVKQVEGKQLV